MKRKEIFASVLAVLIFVAMGFRFYLDITEVVKGHREDLQNVTYTQLVFDERSLQYNVEYEGTKHEFSTFSRQAIFRVNEAERVMFPGKEVVCFEYHDDFWVYPKSQFEGSNIKLLVWAIALSQEMFGVVLWGTLLIFCICIIGCFIYAFIKIEHSDYFHEPINRSDS